MFSNGLKYDTIMTIKIKIDNISRVSKRAYAMRAFSREKAILELLPQLNYWHLKWEGSEVSESSTTLQPANMSLIVISRIGNKFASFSNFCLRFGFAKDLLKKILVKAVNSGRLSDTENAYLLNVYETICHFNKKGYLHISGKALLGIKRCILRDYGSIGAFTAAFGLKQHEVYIFFGNNARFAGQACRGLSNYRKLYDVLFEQGYLVLKGVV